MDELSDEAKIELIESNLQETIGGHVIRDVILHLRRPLSIYWGTATTGRPHVGKLEFTLYTCYYHPLTIN